MEEIANMVALGIEGTQHGMSNTHIERKKNTKEGKNTKRTRCTSKYDGWSIMHFASIKNTQAHIAFLLQFTEYYSHNGYKMCNFWTSTHTKEINDKEAEDPYANNQIAFRRNPELRGHNPPFAPKLKRESLKELLNIHDRSASK